MTTLTVGPTFYPTIGDAMAAAVAGDTIVLGAGYSNETAMVTKNGITIDGGGSSVGITLHLAVGVTGVHLGGSAPINVLDTVGDTVIAGNAGSNVITVTGGTDIVDGGSGIDRLIVDYRKATTAVIGDTTSGFSAAGHGSVTVAGIEELTILAGSGNNSLTLGAGDDKFTATGHGVNTILAGEGNNTIVTGGGADGVTVGSGNDTLVLGDGVNTITGLAGDKIIITGAGADTITLTSGNNQIDAGDGINTITATSGNNHISTGAAADTITVTSGNNAICADGGVNTITATGGDNQISTGDDADTVTVTGGNNAIYAGNGVNTITATSGNNIIITGTDADTVTVTDGSNFIAVGNGVNTVTSGAGNDTVISGVDTDTIVTGGGNDVIVVKGGLDAVTAGTGTDTLVVDYTSATHAVVTGLLAGTEITGYAGVISQGASGTVTFSGIENFDITSGSGNDVITTGNGNDTLNSGTGSDIVQGGGGSDYIYGNAGDTIDGGDGTDTLNLFGAGPYSIFYDPLNSENGVVTFLDSQLHATFTNIESIVNVAPPPPILVPDPADCPPIVACFTLGTMITTPTGVTKIESLKKGDFVWTRDHGYKPILWIGTQIMSGQVLRDDRTLQPIMIQSGALGEDCPSRDMMVSPQHRILLTGARAELLFGAGEVLVKAKHLVSQPGIDVMALTEVTYVHLMFDKHEIILGDGAWSESFQPSDRSISGLDAEQRQELDMIFPEITFGHDFGQYDAARLTLRSHEAKVFLAA